eukprot:gnl/TRDRNA2_/TRDRNA2_161364_c0_seq2.p1 gnl/TRDRNA2_/TRDRNA2_161364_c0~~gnl/TRDRNA2_/TRDRNA2_161364_c0_seq2.p1  ORF type:complete len:117 (-),score=16.99 gnl/TRDRNA2_/TRDRNA2_161364_c0_seq2:147-497(-)
MASVADLLISFAVLVAVAVTADYGSPFLAAVAATAPTGGPLSLWLVVSSSPAEKVAATTDQFLYSSIKGMIAGLAFYVGLLLLLRLGVVSASNCGLMICGGYLSWAFAWLALQVVG